MTALWIIVLGLLAVAVLALGAIFYLLSKPDDEDDDWPDDGQDELEEWEHYNRGPKP